MKKCGYIIILLLISSAAHAAKILPTHCSSCPEQPPAETTNLACGIPECSHSDVEFWQTTQDTGFASMLPVYIQGSQAGWKRRQISGPTIVTSGECSYAVYNWTYLTIEGTVTGYAEHRAGIASGGLPSCAVSGPTYDWLDENPQQCMYIEGTTFICDLDGDGVSDDADPLPDDDRPFLYQAVAKVYDENGNLIAMVYKITDADGNVTYFTWGDTSGHTPIYQMVANAAVGSSDDGVPWSSTPGSGTNSNNNPADNPEGTEVPAGPTPEVDYQPGEEGDTQGTENENLTKIADNTAKIAANQAEQGKQLEGIGGKLDGTNALLQEIAKKPVAGGGGATAADIGTSVGDAVEEKLNEAPDFDGAGAIGGAQAQVDAAYANAESEFSRLSQLLTEDIPAEFQAKKPISEKIEERAQGQLSGLKADLHERIEGIDVQMSGDCEVVIPYRESQITLTVCNFASELQSWGVIIKAITGMAGVIWILFGGKDD